MIYIFRKVFNAAINENRKTGEKNFRPLASIKESIVFKVDLKMILFSSFMHNSFHYKTIYFYKIDKSHYKFVGVLLYCNYTDLKCTNCIKIYGS